MVNALIENQRGLAFEATGNCAAETTERMTALALADYLQPLPSHRSVPMEPKMFDATL